MQDILIGGFQTGLVTTIDSWSIPNDAFVEIENFSLDHGRLVKRSGRSFMGQMVDNTGALTNERIMGISQFQNRASPNITVANTTQYMARWNGSSPGAFIALDAAAPVFNSGNSDFYWYANWQPTGSSTNLMFITNGLPLSGGLNGIRYWDGTAVTTTSYVPTVSTGVTLDGCKMLFTLDRRLVALSTIENGTFFPQRARWSKADNSLEANWNDTIAGNGDFLNAATGEEIISARYFRNSLIVFFKSSVWLFYPTGDPRIAFSWKRLNSFRACDGKMASTAYDEYVAALGIRGINASNGSQTQRIDDRIENFSSDEIKTGSFDRVYSERSYEKRKWWSLYPSNSSTDPDKALVFHEDVKGWTTYSTDLNVLGYVINSFDLKYSDFVAGQTYDSDEFVGLTYQNFNQDDENVFAGGDRNGMIYQLEQGGADATSSTEFDDITCKFTSGILNPWKEEGKEAQLTYVDFLITTDFNTTANILFYKDNDLTPYKTETMDFFPPQGFVASIQDISLANPAVVTSSNHGLSTGDEVYLYGVQGLDDTSATPVNINATLFTITRIDDNTFSLDDVDSSGFSAYEGGGAIYTQEYIRTRVWKRVYAGGVSAAHQIGLESTSQIGELEIIRYRPYFRKVGQREIN